VLRISSVRGPEADVPKNSDFAGDAGEGWIELDVIFGSWVGREVTVMLRARRKRGVVANFILLAK